MPDPTSDIDQTVRAAWNETAPHDQWIAEIADDYVIVIDEKDRSFHRVPVMVGDSVEFGAPVKVTPGYVEVAASAPVHRVVFASRAESRPEVAATVLDSPSPIEQQPPNPILPAEPAAPAAPPDEPPPTEEPLTPPDEGGVSVPGEEPPTMSGAEPEHTEPKKEDPVSLSEMRSRLGLADDADEAAVLTAIDALKTKADAPPQPTPEQVAASAANEAEKDELRKEVSVLASQMQTVTAELAAAKAKEAAIVKASVLDDAKRLGKIAPADADKWAEDYDSAPAVVTRVLASIAPGTAVPVQAAGYTGTGDEQITDIDALAEGEIDSWAKQLGITAEELNR